MNDRPTDSLEFAPRCLNCGYYLRGLDEQRCPECGRAFDLAKPSTYTNKPPLLRWRLWFPALALGVGSGIAIFGALLLLGEVGWGVTLATPFAIGVIVGYFCHAGQAFVIFLSIAGLMSVVGTVVVSNVAGMLCGLMAFMVGIFPAIFGSLLGWSLRTKLKNSDFDQRYHLPLVGAMIMPLGIGGIESLRGLSPMIRAHHTTQIVDASADDVWQCIRFYEQLHHEPPILFKLGAPAPRHTTGSLEAVGDKQVCVFQRGHVTKRLVEREPGRVLAFEIIDQNIGFERSVRLTGGRFDFKPLDEHRTRVTLTTDYEPLLRPRWCWLPFERWVLTTLHEYILEGIMLELESRIEAMPLAMEMHR